MSLSMVNVRMTYIYVCHCGIHTCTVSSLLAGGTHSVSDHVVPRPHGVPHYHRGQRAGGGEGSRAEVLPGTYVCTYKQTTAVMARMAISI